MSQSGVIVAVVGPSGAGKDTLIDYARAKLSSSEHFSFVRRTITRPVNAGGEVHDEVNEDDFRTMTARSEFSLWWQAHGLYYGIPRSTLQDIKDGRVLIVNGSRAALPMFAEVYGDNLRIAKITASPAILAGRLAARGRESRAEILARLSRQTGCHQPLEEDILIQNDRDIETVGEEFTRFLLQLVDQQVNTQHKSMRRF